MTALNLYQSFHGSTQHINGYKHAFKEKNVLGEDNPYLEVMSLDFIDQADANIESKEIVKHVLCKQWSLPTPNLIVSIIGDDISDDTMKYSIRNNFMKDLISTITNTNAWIFTDGKNVGITKEICEAVREIRFTKDSTISSRIPCIGIINKTPEFERNQRRRSTDTILPMENTMKFDYNHSHCLWFKDLTSNDKLQEFRETIEENASEQNFNCPIIQILAGGEEYFIDIVFNTIHRGWPVLIIESENTQTAASIIKENHRNRTDIGQHRMQSNKVHNLLNFYSINKFSRITLYRTIRQTLFNWTKSERDQQKRYYKELQIAITWNYEKKRTVVDQLNKEYLHKGLIDAIFKNRIDFVEYLIEYGASIQYENSDEDIEKYWQIIVEPNVLPVRQEISVRTKKDFYEDYNLGDLKNIVSDKPSESTAIRDWLLWSVFMNRPDMTKCLCSYTQNPVVATLLVNKIYRKAALRALEIKKQEEYHTNEKEFDRRASELIDKCFKIDNEFAGEILLTSSKIYFNQAPLILAESNKTRSFLATKAMWKHLDQMWYGDINEKGHSKLFINFLIFISCIFVFLIPSNFLSKILSSREDYERSLNDKWYKRIGTRYTNFYRGRIAVRFFYNIIIYILFLGLFSYLLLAGYFPLNINGGTRNNYKNIAIPINEIFVHIFSWCFIIEEIEELRRHFQDKKSTRSHHILARYFTDNKWNILDFVTYITYLIGFITRFVVIEEVFVASKIFMCINLFLWYVRILHLFFASEKLGPKLLMIFNTMVDLVFFICFILIFLLGYSVTSYALITTVYQVFWIPTDDGSSSREYTLAKGEHNGTSLWTWNILRNAIGWGIWKIYGEIDIINHNRADNTSISATNDAYGNVAFILTIIFVSVANVLLLNILVALFNSTVQKVQAEAVESWPYHRFILITEYRRKSMLPPPFNLILYIFYLYKDCKTQRKLNDNDSIYPYGVTQHLLWRLPSSKSELRKMYNIERESHIARSYWKSQNNITSTKNDNRSPRNELNSSRPVSAQQISFRRNSDDSQAFTQCSRLNVPSSATSRHQGDGVLTLESVPSIICHPPSE